MSINFKKLNEVIVSLRSQEASDPKGVSKRAQKLIKDFSKCENLEIIEEMRETLQHVDKYANLWISAKEPQSFARLNEQQQGLAETMYNFWMRTTLEWVHDAANIVQDYVEVSGSKDYADFRQSVTSSLKELNDLFTRLNLDPKDLRRFRKFEEEYLIVIDAGDRLAQLTDVEFNNPERLAGVFKGYNDIERPMANPLAQKPQDGTGPKI